MISDITENPLDCGSATGCQPEAVKPNQSATGSKDRSLKPTKQSPKRDKYKDPSDEDWAVHREIDPDTEQFLKDFEFMIDHIDKKSEKYDERDRKHYDNPNKINIPGSKKGRKNAVWVPKAPATLPPAPTAPSAANVMLPVNLPPAQAVAQLNQLPPPQPNAPTNQIQPNNAPAQQPPPQFVAPVQFQPQPLPAPVAAALVGEPGRPRAALSRIIIKEQPTWFSKIVSYAGTLLQTICTIKVLSTSRDLYDFVSKCTLSCAINYFCSKFITLMCERLRSTLSLDFVASNNRMVQRHEQNRLTQPVPTEFVTMKYTVSYRGFMSKILNQLPEYWKFWGDDWTKFCDPVTLKPLEETYNSELLQSVMKPRIVKGHGNLNTILLDIEREINNRSDTITSEDDFQDINTIMSTCNVAKHYAIATHKKASMMDFHSASTTSTNTDIGSSDCRNDGGQQNHRPLKINLKSELVNALLFASGALALCAGVWVYMYGVPSFRSQTLPTLSELLPERLKDQQPKFPSMEVSGQLEQVRHVRFYAPLENYTPPTPAPDVQLYYEPHNHEQSVMRLESNWNIILTALHPYRLVYAVLDLFYYTGRFCTLLVYRSWKLIQPLISNTRHCLGLMCPVKRFL